MRVTVLAALGLAALSSLANANNDTGEYCVIPKLVQGEATTVEVPYIDKPFCGTAMIDKHYVRMSEFAKATEESEPQCSSESFCTKVLRFYQDEAKATKPFILIFFGPQHRKSA